uniref:Very-long-chain 3-oxoacyl-CoA synthase n=1 Tax=Parascaris equorum TaxID=6256 RepID=A0A914RRV5_PAREQ
MQLADMYIDERAARVTTLVLWKKMSLSYCLYVWYLCGMLKEGGVKPVTLLESLQKHIIFSASVPSLLILFAYIGIHNRVVAPSMFVSHSFFIFINIARVELVIRSFEKSDKRLFAI